MAEVGEDEILRVGKLSQTSSFIVSNEAGLALDFLEDQFREDNYMDLEIQCSDGFIPVHRIILMGASPFLRNLFIDKDIHDTPSLTLADVSVHHMAKIVSLLYFGRTIIEGEDFTAVSKIMVMMGFPVEDLLFRKASDKDLLRNSEVQYTVFKEENPGNQSPSTTEDSGKIEMMNDGAQTETLSLGKGCSKVFNKAESKVDTREISVVNNSGKNNESENDQTSNRVESRNNCDDGNRTKNNIVEDSANKSYKESNKSCPDVVEVEIEKEERIQPLPRSIVGEKSANKGQTQINKTGTTDDSIEQSRNLTKSSLDDANSADIRLFGSEETITIDDTSEDEEESPKKSEISSRREFFKTIMQKFTSSNILDKYRCKSNPNKFHWSNEEAMRLLLQFLKENKYPGTEKWLDSFFQIMSQHCNGGSSELVISEEDVEINFQKKTTPACSSRCKKQTSNVESRKTIEKEFLNNVNSLLKQHYKMSCMKDSTTIAEQGENLAQSQDESAIIIDLTENDSESPQTSVSSSPNVEYPTPSSSFVSVGTDDVDKPRYDLKSSRKRKSRASFDSDCIDLGPPRRVTRSSAASPQLQQRLEGRLSSSSTISVSSPTHLPNQLHKTESQNLFENKRQSSADELTVSDQIGEESTGRKKQFLRSVGVNGIKYNIYGFIDSVKGVLSGKTLALRANNDNDELNIP